MSVGTGFRRARRIGALLLLATMVALAAGSISRVHVSDPPWLLRFKLESKHRVMGALKPVVRWLFPVDPSLGPATPLEGPGYFYADLENPYLAKVRSDPRLASFYDDDEALDVEDVAELADFLRDQFPHGAPSHVDPGSADVLELLDGAENGESYLCGTISKMLVELVQAGGGTARIVRLGGHVVTEFWSPDWRKWVLIDPDTDVRYEDRDGTPLDALDLHRIARRHERDELVLIPGRSRNALYREESLQERLVSRYAPGFAVDFNEKWLSLDLARWHPRRSPSRTSVYYTPDEDFDHHPYFDVVVHDPRLLYGAGPYAVAGAPPQRPAARARSRTRRMTRVRVRTGSR